MLTSLSIRNVVLIEKLDLDFEEGLSVFTGETGAGKSILLDSLSLVLGARADTSLIRHGSDSLSVTACFTLPLSHIVWQMLSEQGIDVEADGSLILKRIVTKDGKNKTYINDQPVGVTLLKNIGELIVEIHGQFATYRLLNPATHLDILDAYGELAEDVMACKRAYHIWQDKQAERNMAEQRLMQAMQEEEFLQNALADLQELAPEIGEEQELSAKRTALMNSEKIIESLNTVYALLSDESQGAVCHISQSLRQLDKANQLTEDKFDNITSSVEQAGSILADAVADLERQMEECGDISALPEIEDRLYALKDMARKHHVTPDELPNLMADFESKLKTIDGGRDAIDALKKAEESARLDYLTAAEKLSQKRKKTAEKLDKSVAQELPDLKLKNAVFKTQMNKLDESDWAEHGTDKVMFLVSTNKGELFAPLNKVASGGELARFMLALKVNLVATSDISTLIFDEVDTGIGGATADAVGNRLQRLSDNCQVLVVTHSPQVASYGHRHYVVGKSEQDGRVITNVNPVDDDNRLMEIARMVSGANITESGRKMAEELLQKSCKKNRNN